MNKCYKSIDEQIKYLETNKKIIVSEDERYIFEERNYSSLINPYKEFFLMVGTMKEIIYIKMKLILRES